LWISDLGMGISAINVSLFIRAFGLVGAMSIVRFRTVLKDTKDIAFVFWALSVGLAIGAEAYWVSIVGTVGVSLLIIVLFFSNYGHIKFEEVLLKFSFMAKEGSEIYKEVFDKYLKSYNMLEMRSLRMGQLLELTFHVRFKKPDQQSNFLNGLSALEGIERVILHSGEEWNEE